MTLRALTTALLGACIVVATGAHAGEKAPPTGQATTLTGRYYVGFEMIEFRTCDGQPLQYWVSAPGPLAPLARTKPDAVFTVTANVSAPGAYGHLGAYAHQIRILDARIEKNARVEACERIYKERGISG